MSLQAVSLLGRSELCSRVPAVGEFSGHGLRLRKASFVHYFAAGIKPGSVQALNLKSCRLSSYTCLYHTRGSFPARNGLVRLQATSLQAITADSDSSSGDTVGPSVHAMNFSSDWPDKEDLSHYFEASLQGFQEGIKKLKERALLQSTKQGLKEAVLKLRTVDGQQVLQGDLGSKLLLKGVEAWKTLKPWIKWPLAIFISIFMVVTASFGVAVSRDLVPLWLLGPWIMGSIIRSAFWAVDFAHNAVVQSEPLRQNLITGSGQLLEDFKNGELLDRLRTLTGEKHKEFDDYVTSERSRIEQYFQSGQAAEDFKVYMKLKFSDFSDWSTEKYEDFVDWVRPFWRAFIRLMKKLF